MVKKLTKEEWNAIANQRKPSVISVFLVAAFVFGVLLTLLGLVLKLFLWSWNWLI